MTIIPSYANVVAFFGSDACDRLASMLRYFQFTLNENSWHDFLFLLATPTEKGVASLPQDLPAAILERCLNGCGDPQFIIYQSTADTIHRMYKNGRLNLHIICDDFASGLFPPQAPAELVRILSEVTHINIVPYFYFLLHARDAAATQRQYQLAQRLSADPELPHAHIYLLSMEQDDNSLASPEAIWRALTCEILTVSADKRKMPSNILGSLGYTSLNADEKELYNLRRQHLIDLIRDRADAPYSPAEAWQDLLGDNAPYTDNAADALETVRRWLLSRIHQDLPSTTPAQINNFRILSGALQQQEPDQLFETAQRFFTLNLQGQSSLTQDGNAQQFASARQYMSALLLRLSARPNLAHFPFIALNRLLSSLKTLCSYRYVASAPSYPKKPRLSFMKSPAYMLQCTQIAEDAALHKLEESRISTYAQAYGQMFLHVQEMLKAVVPLSAVLDNLSISASTYAQLQQKYPAYDDNIRSCINLSHSSLLRDMRPYAPAALTPHPADISSALDRAVATVHANMSPGFNSSFINAINHEFATSEDLAGFFSRYLDNQRRMFRNIHETVDPPVVTIYANHMLSALNWEHIPHANLFLVSNDNVERLDYFPLKRHLADYLTDKAQADPANLYFRQSSSGTLPLPQEPKTRADAITLPEPQPDAAPVPQAAPPAEKPLPLRLIHTHRQWLLQWSWDPAISFYSVRINGMDLPVNATMFASLHGLDVTSKLVPGKNEITLSVLSGPVIATQTFCGPKRPIEYKKTPTALHVSCPAEYLSQLFVRESIPVRRRDGTQDVRHLYYPLGASGQALERLPLVYTGLSFSGEWDLVCHPSEQYPQCEPQQNVNL